LFFICICHHNTHDSHNGIQGLSYQNLSLNIVQYSCDFTIQYPHKSEYHIHTFITSCLHIHTFTSIFHHNYRYKSFQKCRMTTTQLVQSFPMLLPNFLPIFLIKFLKNPKIAKNNENPNKYVFFNIFASFLAFSTSSQKNLNSKVF
jgi:hypothetical protein